MAIFFDGNYYKITKSINDFVDKTTDIEMKVYASKETRNREKEIYDKVQIFIQNVNSFLINTITSIIDDTNKIQDVNTIKDRECFLLEHLDIKERVELYEEMQKEGLLLIDSILKKDINISNLKYLAKWKELGFDDGFKQKIDYLGNTIIGINELKENDISILYNIVKERIVGEVEDC